MIIAGIPDDRKVPLNTSPAVGCAASDRQTSQPKASATAAMRIEMMNSVSMGYSVDLEV